MAELKPSTRYKKGELLFAASKNKLFSGIYYGYNKNYSKRIIGGREFAPSRVSRNPISILKILYSELTKKKNRYEAELERLNIALAENRILQSKLEKEWN